MKQTIFGQDPLYKLKEMFKIADVHGVRMMYAIEELRAIFPMTAQRVVDLSHHHFLCVELLVYRFSKIARLFGSRFVF